MGLLYLGFVVVSTVCVGLVDRRWRLALFDRPARTLAVVAAGSLLFLAWDLCLLYTSPSPRDATLSRMPSSA